MQEKIYIQTYGCSMNYSDSEVMAGLLQAEDYQITNQIDDADVVIINSCTVKDAAEKKLKFLAKKILKNEKQKLIVTGCVPQADKNWLKEPENNKFKIIKNEKKEEKELNYENNISVLGVRQVNKIAYVVEEALLGNSVELLSVEKNERLNLPKLRRNKHIEIIPINQGCLGNCYFCKTKMARGTIMSYQPESIVKQMNEAISEGIKEIWITSQDTGAYGYDIRTRLHHLINELTEQEGDFFIRLGMINPDLVIKILDELIESFKSEKMFKFLHIPLQAGSDTVLKNMNRLYTVKQFEEIIKKFKNAFPEITIATDIITGYPSESEEDFQKSIDLCKKHKIPIVNISKYFPRAGTRGAALTQLNSKIRKDRSKRLTEAIYSYDPYSFWKDWSGRVLFSEAGKNNTLVGRNYAYVPIVVDVGDKKNFLGTFQNVKVVEVRRDYLVGELV